MSSELDAVRAMASAGEVLEALIARAVRDAWSAGVPRHRIAAALGVSRATLYRRFGLERPDGHESV